MLDKKRNLNSTGIDLTIFLCENVPQLKQEIETNYLGIHSIRDNFTLRLPFQIVRTAKLGESPENKNCMEIKSLWDLEMKADQMKQIAVVLINSEADVEW